MNKSVPDWLGMLPTKLPDTLKIYKTYTIQCEFHSETDFFMTVADDGRNLPQRLPRVHCFAPPFAFTTRFWMPVFMDVNAETLPFFTAVPPRAVAFFSFVQSFSFRLQGSFTKTCEHCLYSGFEVPVEEQVLHARALSSRSHLFAPLTVIFLADLAPVKVAAPADFPNRMLFVFQLSGWYSASAMNTVNGLPSPVPANSADKTAAQCK